MVRTQGASPLVDAAPALLAWHSERRHLQYSKHQPSLFTTHYLVNDLGLCQGAALALLFRRDDWLSWAG